MCAFRVFRNVCSKYSECVFRLCFLDMLANRELPVEVFAVRSQLVAVSEIGLHSHFRIL